MDLMSKKGFTLIELLVTISIIAILSAVGLVFYMSVMQQGRDSKRQSDLRAVQSALEQYFNDQFNYPMSTGITFDGSSSLSGGGKTYLNATPADPQSSPKYCYKPLKKSESCDSLATPPDCDNTSATASDWCVNYCLYAYLESQAAGSYSCGSTINYNFKITPP